MCALADATQGWHKLKAAVELEGGHGAAHDTCCGSLHTSSSLVAGANGLNSDPNQTLMSSSTRHRPGLALPCMQINTTMLLFSFGFVMWVARLCIQAACRFALSKLLYDVVDGAVSVGVGIV